MIKFKLVNGKEGYEKTKEIREKLLSLEKDIPYEYEKTDDEAIHIYGEYKDRLICYARMYKSSEYTFSIDKIVVDTDFRKKYVADTIIRAFEDRAVALGVGLIKSKVSEGAWEFFEHEGYECVGDVFEENKVLYKLMKRDLTKIRGCKGGCHK